MTTILCDSCHRIHRKGNYWEVVVLSRVLGDGTFVLYHFHIILCGFPPGAHKTASTFLLKNCEAFARMPEENNSAKSSDMIKPHKYLPWVPWVLGFPYFHIFCALPGL